MSVLVGAFWRACLLKGMATIGAFIIAVFLLRGIIIEGCVAIEFVYLEVFHGAESAQRSGAELQVLYIRDGFYFEVHNFYFMSLLK